MQIESAEIVAFLATASAVAGYCLRQFIPVAFKKTFQKYGNNTYSKRLFSNTEPLSFSQHSILCDPIKTQLTEALKEFATIRQYNEKISLEIRWLRALAVVQAPADAIKKADEIIGITG